MARHRKDFDGERLAAQVTVQLTPTDRAELDAAVAQLGQTASAFARDWILEGIRSTAKARVLIDVQQTGDRQMTDDLVRRGQVLNGWAKAANESQEIADTGAVSAALGQVVEVIDRIGAVVKGTVTISPERRALMNEVTRVGNNIMQLQSVARSRQAVETVKALEAAQDRIVACVERMIS